MWPDFINWILGTILIYGALFGFGKIIFLEYKQGIIYLLITVISGFFLYKNLTRKNGESF